MVERNKMRRVHTRRFQVLSLSLVAGLFLCHVLGNFCPIVPMTHAATPIIQDSPTGHSMAGEHSCSNVLPSSDKRLDTCGLETPVSIDGSLSYAPEIGAPSNIRDDGPQKLGLPLYTLLSTFRI